MEEFKIEIIADKRKADELFSMLTNAKSESLGIPPIPIEAIREFVTGDRSSIWEVTVNDEVFLTITADKSSAIAFLAMLEEVKENEFPIVPLPTKNLRAFIQGQRSNVATLHIRKDNLEKSSEKK
jgi:hypothetical protein